MTFEELAEDTERHGFRIVWEPMEDDFVGAADLVRGIIYLDPRLDSRPRHAVSTLAHELGHMALGHGCKQNIWGEQKADEWAASLLISPTEYQIAERMYGPCVPKLAVELGVTQQIVRAYQQTLNIERLSKAS